MVVIPGITIYFSILICIKRCIGKKLIFKIIFHLIYTKKTLLTTCKLIKILYNI